MKMKLLVVLSAACAAAAGGAADLAALAKEEYSHAVFPGGVEGRPFWNKYARMFMYPPAFDFDGAGEKAVKYRFSIHDSVRRDITFDADSPNASLAPVWDRIAPGFVWVWVSAVDKDGRTFGIPSWPRDRFSRYFWKSAPFKPGGYPPKPRSYAEAAAKCGDQIFGRKAIQYFLKNGKPDPDYGLNCYPSKMNSALIHMMIAYGKMRPARREAALKFARIAADYTISISQPAGAPLEFLPPTYAGTYQAAAWRSGRIMMMYPAEVGNAYLSLYAATKEAKYLEAAKRIAGTYVKLQEADGTWPVLLFEKDGKAEGPHRLQPIRPATLLEGVYAATGEKRFREAADRAFAWVREHPMKDWFWEGQFEDAPLIAKYENPSKDPAIETLRFVLKRFPGDAQMMSFAREAMRYAEDQFICWEKPCQPNGMGVNSSIADPLSYANDYDTWFFPCALEQLVYYVPIDASVANEIFAFLALYDVQKNPLDLARARALGDALVRVQRPNGYIPTEIFKEPDIGKEDGGWLNCTCYTVRALTALAEHEDEK